MGSAISVGENSPNVLAVKVGTEGAFSPQMKAQMLAQFGAKIQNQPNGHHGYNGRLIILVRAVEMLKNDLKNLHPRI